MTKTPKSKKNYNLTHIKNFNFVTIGQETPNTITNSCFCGGFSSLLSPPKAGQKLGLSKLRQVLLLSHSSAVLWPARWLAHTVSAQQGRGSQLLS